MLCPNVTCSPNEFTCRNGKCISLSHICDGDKDCFYGDDELNCTTTTTNPPTTTSTTVSTTITTTLCTGFKCSSDNQCFSSEKYICDGYKDCKVLGEDESCCGNDVILCPTPIGSYLGHCIGKRTICDGYLDCEDGWDERNCSARTTQPPTTTFTTTTDKIIIESTTTTQTSGAHGNTTTGPTKCPRNSICLCENTCDSLAGNPTGCLTLQCTDQCECPDGFSINIITGFCDRNVDCPCTKNGKIFRMGDVVDEGNCTKCMCSSEGFNDCIQSCPITFCDEGFEIVSIPGQCCECRKKLVCRADQVLSDCACGLSCDVNNNKPCDTSNCKKGCVCPKGKFDNGTHCVKAEACYCSTKDGTKYDPNKRWKNGTCEICKCVQGQITCGKTCQYYRCSTGFELIKPTDGCCFCRKIEVVTTSTPWVTTSSRSTYTTLSTSSQSTRQPIYKCSKSEEHISYKDGENCTSVGLVIRSKCSGGCNTVVISDLSRGVGIKDCSCCKPTNIQSAMTQLKCPNGKLKDFKFKIFEKCFCQPCDSSPFDDVPLLQGSFPYPMNKTG